MAKKEGEFSTDDEDMIKKTLQMSEISLVLDCYDDIFSDFDPRPYFERSLSVDLLEETERASIDKPYGELDLNFLIPLKQRDLTQESMIKKRLKEHFKKHLLSSEKEKGSIIKKGIIFTFFGVIFMFLATFSLYYFKEKSMIASFFTILFEPASWFLFWEGLNQILFESKKISPKLVFYRKMQRCTIHFFTY